MGGRSAGAGCVIAGGRYGNGAIVGAAGLRPTLAAARAGKKILLANKEALVMAGRGLWIWCINMALLYCPLTVSITPSFRLCPMIIPVITG